MRRIRIFPVILLLSVAIGIGGLLLHGAQAMGDKKMVDKGKGETTDLIEAELEAIEKIFRMKPGYAIDTRVVSKTLCMNAEFGRGGHMTHFSLDPENSTNDIIDFIDARPLIKAGLDGEKFPTLPEKAGTLTPGKWYFLPEGEEEPYHGRSFGFPIIVKAVDVR